MSGFSLTSLNNFYIKTLETPTPPLFTSTHEEPLEARIWQAVKKIFLIAFMAPVIFLIVRPILWAQRTIEVKEAPAQEPPAIPPPELPPASTREAPPPRAVEPSVATAPINPSLLAAGRPGGLPREGNTSFVAATLQAIRGTSLEEAIIESASDTPGIVAVREIFMALRTDQFPSYGALERARSIDSRFEGPTERYSALFLECLMDLPEIQVLTTDGSRQHPSTFAAAFLRIDMKDLPPKPLETLLQEKQEEHPLNSTPDTLFCVIDWLASDDQDTDRNACQLLVPLDLPSTLLQTEAPYRLRSFVCLEGSEDTPKFVSYVRKTDASGIDSYFQIDGPQVAPLNEAVFVQAARRASFVTYQTNHAALASD
ncbi:MAG: hypothetical protein JSR76_05665 [Verrucomicrobia bacterium]|nr:hypothetical protein [Verrucomicrobiota bacterium]